MMIGETSSSATYYSVARLRDGGPDGRILGSGFLVCRGVILTCEHVIRGSESSDLWVEFPQGAPLDGSRGGVIGRGRQGTVDDILDSALVDLNVSIQFPDPLRLRQGIGQLGSSLTSFGFPVEGYADGTIGRCESGTLIKVGGRFLMQVAEANSISLGFSGAPLLDQDGFVVGMVTAIPGEGKHGRLREIAYAVPAGALQDRYGELKVSLECPYPGLLPYTSQQADWFFGRDAAVQDVISALTEGPQVQLLLGASGSGKSSLIAAGVFEQIRGGHVPRRLGWDCLLVRASDGPEVALDAIESVHDKSRLVVLDQFEEVLLARTEAGSADETGPRPERLGREHATAVIDAIEQLLTAGLAGQLLVVLRSDFTPQLEMTLPGLLRQNRFIHVVGALGEVDLRAVIEQPAQLQGWHVTPGLTRKVINELLEGRASASLTDLPLLALHLRELWFASQDHDNVLTEASPGVDLDIRQAFAVACDRSFRELSKDQQRTAQQVLLDLVRPADPETGVPATRRRRTIARLEEAYPGATAVVTHLADARIIATGTPAGSQLPTAELVHDSLIERWDAMRTWLAAQPEYRSWRERIDPRADNWSAQNTRSQGDLLAGSDLVEAERFLDHDNLPPALEKYIRVSLRAENRRTRIRRNVAIGLAALTALSVINAVVAYTKQQEARDALNSSVRFQILRASDSLSGSNPSVAAQLVLDAYRMNPTEETAARLRAYSVIGLSNPLFSHKGAVTSVLALNENSRLVLSGGDDGMLRLWNLAAPSMAKRVGDPIDTGQSGITAFALGGDGKLLVSAGRDGTFRFWDVSADFKLSAGSGRVRAGQGAITSLALRPDGKALAVAGRDGMVRIWEITAGKRAKLIGSAVMRYEGRSSSIAYSPDGRTLVVAGSDKKIQFWNVENLRIPKRRATAIKGSSPLVFNREGSALAAFDGKTEMMHIWDTSDISHPKPLSQFSAKVSSVAFAEADRISVGTEDGAIKPLQLGLLSKNSQNRSGYSEIFRVPKEHVESVNSICHVGPYVVSGGQDGYIRVLHLPSYDYAFGPDSQSAVRDSDGLVASANGSIALIQRDTPEISRLASRVAGSWLTSVAFTVNGSVLIAGSTNAINRETAGTDSHIQLWNVEDVARPQPLGGPIRVGGGMEVMAVSGDDKYLAVATSEGDVKLFDIANANAPRLVSSSKIAADDSVRNVSRLRFSHNGTLLAGAVGRSFVVWSLPGLTVESRIVASPESPYGSVGALEFGIDDRALFIGASAISRWDITDLKKPARVGIPFGSRVKDLYVVSDAVLYSAGGRGMTGWDISNPDLPVKQGPGFDEDFSLAPSSFSNRAQFLYLDDSVGTLWSLKMEDVVSRVCQTSSQALTPDVWARHLGEVPFDPPCDGKRFKLSK